MNSPRFKVGDKVIAIKYRGDRLPTPHSQKGYPKINQIVTINEIVTYGRDYIYWFNECKNGMFEEELENPEIYNSPLYKALREEN